MLERIARLVAAGCFGTRVHEETVAARRPGGTGKESPHPLTARKVGDTRLALSARPSRPLAGFEYVAAGSCRSSGSSGEPRSQGAERPF